MEALIKDINTGEFYCGDSAWSENKADAVLMTESEARECVDSNDLTDGGTRLPIVFPA